MSLSIVIAAINPLDPNVGLEPVVDSIVESITTGQWGLLATSILAIMLVAVRVFVKRRATPPKLELPPLQSKTEPITFKDPEKP